MTTPISQLRAYLKDQIKTLAAFQKASNNYSRYFGKLPHNRPKVSTEPIEPLPLALAQPLSETMSPEERNSACFYNRAVRNMSALLLTYNKAKKKKLSHLIKNPDDWRAYEVRFSCEEIKKKLIEKFGIDIDDFYASESPTEEKVSTK